MQWLMLASSLIVMAVFQRLTRGAPLEARATLALGFLVFVAHLAGTLAQRARLPRITGYLLAGFLVGPWLGFVREGEATALDMFSSGALALIALSAGLALPLRALWQERRGLLRIVAGASAFPFALVTLVVLTISPWFPLTAHQPFRDALTIALILGAFAVLSSPVVTWAVVTDAGARGPLTRSIPGVALALDVIAVLLLVLVIAAAQLLASGGAATPGVALPALLRLVGSVAAGALLGLAATQYLRVIREHVIVVLIAVAFVVAFAMRHVGLEAVLMALAAGYVIQATTPHEATRLKSALDKCALPIYVVFFGLAGAGLRLEALANIWPWALLLIGLRLTGLRVAGRWSGGAWANYGWLGLVPQGGMAITLAAIARRAFPEWNVSIEALLVAMIGVQLILGPVGLHWALRRSGEVVEEAHVPRQDEALVHGTGVGGVGVGGGRV